MISQIGPSSISGDIFHLREKIINDIFLQNNLDKIKQRASKNIKSKKKNQKKYQE
jgi:hypothetical protein